MSSDYKISFTLKQHTPLIHFQHDQPGATLRATELKPKLDKFLLMKDPTLPTLPKQPTSLNYKVRIDANPTFEAIDKPNPNNLSKTIKNPLYFGDMGSNEKKKFSTSDTVKLTFTSLNKKVLQAIEEYIEPFFAVTNFGTRQSKGFGSFYLKDKIFNPAYINSSKYTKVYKFKANKNNYQDHIKLLYSFLRTGINDFNYRTQTSKFYTKPASFLFAKKNGWIWEKKAIKTELLNIGDKDDKEKYRLIRDIFGLSSEQLWLTYDKETIIKEHSTIDRFKSPIFFKPIQNRDIMEIYFFAEKDIEPILSQTFTIKTKKRHKKMNIKTPEHFDMEEFLEFAISLDLEKIVEPKYHGSNSYNTLKKILHDARSMA